MRIKIFIILFLFVSQLSFALPQNQLVKDFSQGSDNIYGEYLLTSVDKKISLELEKANLLDVLKMFSQYTGLNFVSTETVKERTLTLYMEKVPLREAMNIIFKANNLTYDYYPEANIFVVKEMGKPSIELDTKVYRLKYARVTGSKFQAEVESITGGSSSVVVKEAVERNLSEFGKIIEDPVTNSLIVTDVPVQFPVIDKIISALDIPTPKVLIEVEMLDVNKTVIDELGVTFGGATGGFQMDFEPFSTRSGTTTTANTYTFSSSPCPWRESWYTLTYNPLLKAILRDTTTKILARPKILTLSGETAEIGITTDEVVSTIVNKAETTGETVTVTPERAETGISLRVTPLVNTGTDEITIVLQPTVRDTSASEFGDTEGNEFINVEETTSKSVLRLKDNQTLLIGGLIKEKSTYTEEKTPLLWKIPFLGNLFQGKNKNDQSRELLIFLTPHIVQDTEYAESVRKDLKLEAVSLAAKKGVPFREQEVSVKKDSVKYTLDKLSD